MMNKATCGKARREAGRRRAATTLVEMLGTLSVLLVLGVSSARLLGAVTEVGAYSAHRKQVRASVLRLAEKFRMDVRNARHVTLSDQRWPIEMTPAGATIRYDWDRQSHAIERSANDGKKRFGVERFQLSDHCQPRASLTAKWVTLVLNEGEQSKPWVIEAYQE
jgi:YD repeat-containing protein